MKRHGSSDFNKAGGIILFIYLPGMLLYGICSLIMAVAHLYALVRRKMGYLISTPAPTSPSPNSLIWTAVIVMEILLLSAAFMIHDFGDGHSGSISCLLLILAALVLFSTVVALKAVPVPVVPDPVVPDPVVPDPETVRQRLETDRQQLRLRSAEARAEEDRLFMHKHEERTYIWKDEQQQGPFSDWKIKRMLSSGELNRDDWAWREGMADWAPLGTL